MQETEISSVPPIMLLTIRLLWREMLTRSQVIAGDAAMGEVGLKQRAEVQLQLPTVGAAPPNPTRVTLHEELPIWTELNSQRFCVSTHCVFSPFSWCLTILASQHAEVLLCVHTAPTAGRTHVLV